MSEVIPMVPNLQPQVISDIFKYYKVRCELTNGEIEIMNYYSGREARDDFNTLANAVPKVYLSLALINREGTELERR